jgi:hypothetical protein
MAPVVEKHEFRVRNASSAGALRGSRIRSAFAGLFFDSADIQIPVSKSVARKQSYSDQTCRRPGGFNEWFGLQKQKHK